MKFKSPKICVPKDENLKKQWYVYFQLWNGALGKYEQKREYVSNALNKAERFASLQILQKKIQHMLTNKEATNPVFQKTNTRKILLIEAVELSIAFKKTTVSPRTYHGLTSSARLFFTFLKKEKIENIFLSQLNRVAAAKFMQWINSSKKISAKTFNNYLDNYNSPF